MKQVKLVIIRHGQSQWNKENRFTGWADVPLTDQGREEARKAGQVIKDLNIEFYEAHTSVLMRSIHTLWEILKVSEMSWLQTYKSWRLNERHYGGLTGLNKKETAEKYGADQVFEWRRSFSTKPPQLEMDDERHPIHDKRYVNMLPANQLPSGESLETTLERFMPYWEEVIKARLLEGKNLLVAAHGNSLRALMLNLEGLSETEITKVEISTGVPIVYTLEIDTDKSIKILQKEILSI